MSVCKHFDLQTNWSVNQLYVFMCRLRSKLWLCMSKFDSESVIWMAVWGSVKSAIEAILAYFSFSCTLFDLCFFSSLLLFISIFYTVTWIILNNMTNFIVSIKSKCFRNQGGETVITCNKKSQLDSQHDVVFFLMISISGQPDCFLFLFRRLIDFLFFYLSKLTFVRLVCEVRRRHLEITFVHSIWLFCNCLIVASLYSSRWLIDQKHNLRSVNFMLISVALV